MLLLFYCFLSANSVLAFHCCNAESTSLAAMFPDLSQVNHLCLLKQHQPSRSSPSFFIPARKHLLSLQKRHWFLLSLSTMHCLLNLHKSSVRWCRDRVKNKSKAQEFEAIHTHINVYIPTNGILHIMIVLVVSWWVCTCRCRRDSCVWSAWRSPCSHRSWTLRSVCLWPCRHKWRSWCWPRLDPGGSAQSACSLEPQQRGKHELHKSYVSHIEWLGRHRWMSAVI